MENRDWVVYLVRCADKSLYCGITNNLKKRLAEHGSGKGARYTRSRRPVELVAASSKMSKSDALKYEYRIKQLPSGRKVIELIEDTEEAKIDIKKELDKVGKGIQALTKKIEKLIVVTESAALKSKPAGKAPVKKSVTKAPAKSSAADKVFGIVKRSKNGVDTGILMQRTGYDKKKIYNIVFKLKKLNKIKSGGKGLYLSV